MSNGKGDSPRNCFSKKFKDNYDVINWGRVKTLDEVCGSPKGTFKKFVEEQSESEKFSSKRKCPYCEGSVGNQPTCHTYVSSNCKYCNGTGRVL